MKLKVNFNEVNLLLNRAKTKNLKSEMPAFTMTKGGNTTLNRAFTEKYFKKAPKTLYYQIGKQEGDYYLFITDRVQDGFYSFTKNSKTNLYYTRAAMAIKHLGKKKESRVYNVSPVKVEGIKVRGFKLELIPAE